MRTRSPHTLRHPRPDEPHGQHTQAALPTKHPAQTPRAQNQRHRGAAFHVLLIGYCHTHDRSQLDTRRNETQPLADFYAPYACAWQSVYRDSLRPCRGVNGPRLPVAGGAAPHVLQADWLFCCSRGAPLLPRPSQPGHTPIQHPPKRLPVPAMATLTVPPTPAYPPSHPRTSFAA